MPAPRLHETVIAERIVELINENLADVLGLKIAALGALELFPALEDLPDNVPAVFVKPAPATNLERITTGQTYRVSYHFRIVFVKPFGPREQVIKTKTLETQKIAELLIDNINLDGLTLENGQILSSMLNAIEWEPPEDNLVATINANMTASALVFTVETTSRK
ncbi:MAG: hypothetical protein A2218_10370 [Elusimicrobia bacterium RIFOXYA2_FULL_53_38]|nr:MAG: hypothetical protein A2218_10370 [Elusimicrobia bacterium RIFOXYA2_FULL_53_38]